MKVSIKKRCVECGTCFEIIVEAAAFKRWQTGTMIQEAFPELSADIREVMISGMCGKCFDNLFKEDA